MAIESRTQTQVLSQDTDSWRQVLLDHYHIDVTLDDHAADHFSQTLQMHRVGKLSIFEQQGTPFHASRRLERTDCLVTVLVPMSGEGRLSLGGCAVPLAAGNILAYHSCRVSELAYRTDYRLVALTLPAELVAERCPEWDCDTLLVLPATEGAGAMLIELASALARHLESMSEASHRDASRLLVSVLVSAIKVGTGDPATRLQDYHRERIRRFVLGRLRDPDLDVPRVAAGVGLSVRYVYRLFGDEPLHLMQWIYDKRLLRCREDIADPARAACSISEIAFAWGFNSPAHFSRAFRKRFGCTPSEYRTRATGKPPRAQAVQRKWTSGQDAPAVRDYVQPVAAGVFVPPSQESIRRTVP